MAQQNEEKKSFTYCQLCKVECLNGMNWSRHIASIGHIKKMPFTPPTSKFVVNLDMDNEDGDDDWYVPAPTKTKLHVSKLAAPL
jgi:hypothetical protein